MNIKIMFIVLIIASNVAIRHATAAVNENSSTLNKINTKQSLSTFDELRDLQQQQADLMVNSKELSSLRVQYALAQLWSLFNDTNFIYWTHQLQRRLLQLKRVNTDLVSAATESLVYISANFPRTVPCKYFGANSLECSIANILIINKRVQNRRQKIFSSAGAQSWLADWNKRWQQTLQITAGYLQLKQEMEQFLVDNPDVTVYFQLLQDFSVKSSEIFADPSVAAEVNGYAQQWTADIQTILNTTEYTEQLKNYTQRIKTLLEADPSYEQLLQDGEKVTKSLDNLMQGIYSAVENCTRLGYGNRCFNPQFNNLLQSSLPRSSSTAKQVLVNSALFAEKYYQFTHVFTQDPEVQTLQKETADKLQAILEPVSTELQEAQGTYIERVFSIAIIYDKLANLWDQLKELGQQLSFIKT